MHLLNFIATTLIHISYAIHACKQIITKIIPSHVIDPQETQNFYFCQYGLHDFTHIYNHDFVSYADFWFQQRLTNIAIERIYIHSKEEKNIRITRNFSVPKRKQMHMEKINECGKFQRKHVENNSSLILMDLCVHYKNLYEI